MGKELHKPLKSKDLNNCTPSVIRKKYLELADDMNAIIDGQFWHCPHCGKWFTPEAFPKDNRHRSGIYPICTNCLEEMATVGKTRSSPGSITEESMQSVLRMMNRPWVPSIFTQAGEQMANDRANGIISSLFKNYLGILAHSSYGNSGWDSSDFSYDAVRGDNEDPIPDEAIKRWGLGFTRDDYLYLEDQYEDWTNRYECMNKTQEELFKNIVFNQLETYHARLSGKSTKDLVKSFQEMLDTMNITPKQNKVDQLKEGQTFGTMIQKWEETEPCPELEPDLMDIEQVGKVCDILLGHASKTAGIKSAYSENYERFMKEYKVNPPEGRERDSESSLFNSLFGDQLDFE